MVPTGLAGMSSSLQTHSAPFQYNFLNHLSTINFKDKIMIHVIDDSKN